MKNVEADRYGLGMLRASSRRDPVIWFTSRTLPTEDDPVKGSFVLDQAKAVSTFAKVEILNLRPVSIRGRVGPLAIHPTRNLIFISLPTRLGHTFSEAFRLVARMIFRGRPSLIHGHWSNGLHGVAIASRLTRVPLVITEHGGPFPSRSSQVAQARKTLNMADAVVSVSNWLRRELIEQGVTAPIIVIPNIVDAVFHPTPLPLDGEIRAVVVARLDGFDKGIPEVIHAVQKLSNEGLAISLTVVGDGADRPRLQRLSRAIACPIHFLGTLNRFQIAELLAKSHLLVSGTRTFETFGVAVAEALAAGRPVVATEVGAIPELVRTGFNGILIKATDPNLISQGIQTSIDRRWDPLEISDSVTHCRSDRVAQDLKSLYVSLVSKIDLSW